MSVVDFSNEIKCSIMFSHKDIQLKIIFFVKITNRKSKLQNNSYSTQCSVSILITSQKKREFDCTNYITFNVLREL